MYYLLAGKSLGAKLRRCANFLYFSKEKDSTISIFLYEIHPIFFSIELFYLNNHNFFIEKF